MPNLPTGKSFMSNVMDTLLMKNSFRRRSISVEPVTQNHHQVFHVSIAPHSISLALSFSLEKGESPFLVILETSVVVILRWNLRLAP